MLTEAPLCCGVKQSECEGITHNVERPLAAQVQEVRTCSVVSPAWFPAGKVCMLLCACVYQ